MIELLATLQAKDIQLALKDGQLLVQGNKQALSDPALLARMREHKPALIELLGSGDYTPGTAGQVQVPANGIGPDCTQITPAMLGLVELSQAEIDSIVARVPGGAPNVQDIYPLTPLQEGILFHHMSTREGDPYLLQAQFAFADTQRLDAFAQALQTVIGRHDILRTSVLWDGLPTPVQVVWREAWLRREEVVVAPGEGDVLAGLLERFAADRQRLDLSQAPLLQLVHAWDAVGQRIVALLLFHHLALDHSALEVVRAEMQACLLGQAEQLGTPLPFRNYVAQARLGLAQQEHERFFRDMLATVDAPTLPYGLQDVQGDGSTLHSAEQALPAPLSQGLRAQGRLLGVSVASLFHLAWAQVLAVLGGRRQVVFGTVLMGRLQGAEATERALGIFINSLPLRVDIDSQGVQQAVRNTHARLAALMRHEHAPLALAQRCSAVTAPTPLFSALLNYRHGSAPQAVAASPAWDGISALASQERTNYPLTLSVDDFGEGFRLTLLASPQIAPLPVLGYLHCALEQLVQALEQAPDTPLEQLRVLPATERAQLLEQFNASARPLPQPLTIAQRFEQQALRQPQALALVCAGRRLTYAELNHRANALAHRLIGLGVRPEDRVAIVAGRGLEALIGMLAVFKAGAGYVPVDATLPAQRLAYLLEDSAPALVLVQPGLAVELAGLRVVELAGLAACADNPQVPGQGPANLAYVIYTSGSTGLPKGVMVEQGTLANLVEWHCATFGLTAGQQTSCLAGFGFDALAWEIWPTLCAGATLHVLPQYEQPLSERAGVDVDTLLAWWRAQPLDVSFLPTPIAEYAFSQRLEHPTLRTLLIGGERLRQFNHDQRYAVVNNYGPTEATVVASSATMHAGQPLHIGKPLSNVRLYVLDEQRQPLPVGVPGELYIGGAGVARGYLNRPQLSAERFLDDPFSPLPGARMYRTGDLVRWRADGSLDYLGRNDDQVKIRGMRIELGEIESCLGQLPGIDEAVVLACEAQPGETRLVAYCTGPAAHDPHALRSQLLGQLPSYMVPAAFVGLAALPLTANGKIDRQALPAADAAALLSRRYQAPEGELECLLAALWAQLLQVEQVGRQDNFFELGGHSLLAMRLVAQVRQQLGLELSLAELFANAELAALALLLGRASQSSLPALCVGSHAGPLPLSFAQQRLWFLAGLEGGGSAYNIPLALRLRGALDRAALQQALARIVERHDCLRSRFVGGEQPQVLIEPAVGLPLHELDLRQAADAEATLQQRVRQQAAQPFDLQGEAPIRGELVQLADNEHALLLTVHHIVADGWSMAVLGRELGALYQAFSQGQPDPLPALSVQYLDYAVWQRRWLEGAPLQAQAAFWQHSLAGAPTLLTLPSDRPRPPQQNFAGASLRVQLDAELSAGLKALARQHGVTLFVPLLAAWATLMSRLSGQHDVLIGTPVANRTLAQVEGLIGLFVNTLAIRIDTTERPDTAALLAQVQARVLAAQANQDLPFEQVVELLQPPRSRAHSPLFQTMFSWEQGSAAQLSLDALRVEGLGGSAQFAKFDLTLNLREAGEGLVGELEYASALFDLATVQRFAGYFLCLLRAMVDTPQLPLEQVQLLAPAERAQLLATGSAKVAAYPQGLTIVQRIERQVAAQPLALAAQQAGQTLTYATLNRRANALAQRLIALGVGPEQRVALLAWRGLDMLVGLLAVLKAGAGYVPLDPALPVQRLNYLLEDSAPAVVLLQPGLGDELKGRVVVELGGEEASDINPVVLGLSAASLAYVIYTSGSTGLPKGVMVEHGTLGNLVEWHCAAFGLDAGQQTSCLAGLGFDALAWEIWPALCAGATLHLLPALEERSHRVDIEAMLDWWRAQPLDISFLPTPVAEQAFHHPQQHPTLRTLLVGGERLRQLPAGLPYSVINNYGPTETTIVASSARVHAGHALHIGSGIDNARLYVLDANQQLAPSGVAGELYIGGGGVARGYFNRPQLDAQRFLSDPFSREPGARMYRSGDLVRWRSDGNLDYLGRNDDQVKIRGMRIELGEIEACLGQLPNILEAVVLAREDQPGEPRLVAYFTEQAAVELHDLRSQLLACLPAYMVPTAFVRLTALPLTANGKLDRRALPAPDASALPTRHYQAPEGELECLLAQIWRELLQVEHVGRQDHFFELGGHSLLAMRMAARVREQLGLELNLGELFANAELAAVAQSLGQAARSSLPPLRAEPRDAPLPLSFAQQRLWFLAQLDGASSAYNIPLALRLHGELDAAALEQALQRIVERHESLRSRFVGTEQPQVLIAPGDGGFVLQRQDLSAQPQPAAALDALREAEASSAFDLATGPLLRGRLLRLGAQQHVLLLTLHHIVADGWSMGVLTEELLALYQALRDGQPDPLPPLAVQYGDYARWQRRWLSGDVLQQQATFWQQNLAGAPGLLTLPTDRPRPAQQDYRGASVALALGEPMSDALKALCQRHGVTLHMLVLAAWSMLLARLAGQAEVVVGVPVANRRSAEVEGLIGLFVNTLALRIDTCGELDTDALLARVKACSLQAQAHQDLPFEQVVELARPSRSLAHSPLFQTLLSWQERHAAPLQLAGLTVQGLGADSGFAKFDLALNLGDGPQGISGDLTYASALFDAATIQRYAGYFTRLLQAMLADEHQRLDQVDLLPAAERRQLLETFNRTEVPYNLQQTVHGLFEAQVERSPEALAVAAEGQALSYAELNRQANRLAHYLASLGVGPEQRVALCLERGVPMVVGLLAVLKAGAAYVPLDPDYPAERLNYMLDNSAPLALLVHGPTRERLASVACRLIDLDQPCWQDQPQGNPQPLGLHSRHLAYVIYTSGSTGQPKGVMNEHAAVVNRLLWMQDAYRLDSTDTVLQKTPFSFDVSVWEFFWPLLSGARLFMARPGGHRDPAYLCRVIGAERVSVCHFVPSMLDVFLSHPQARQCSGLRQMICSGEALPGRLVRRLREQLPGCALGNLYGPTEAAVDVSAWACNGPLAQVADNTPIGKPIANTRLYVLDAALQPVPLGVPGELYIGGVQVARGYLNRAQLTAERFLDDPFAEQPGARLYRTGDMARYLADGNLEYLGRNDDQVKLRGLRIELGEIQAALTALVGVNEAVVLAREDEPGDMRLVAYYSASTAVPGENLRRQLLQRLPDYMVPAHFVHLPALPLSANGKLDRKALPAPAAGALAAAGYQAPQGALETRLAEVWAGLLKLERVGRQDNFFELGGHSLLAVRLVGLLQQAGLALSLAEVFQHAKLEAMAALLEQRPASATPELIELRSGQGTPLFLLHEFTGLDAYFPALSQHLAGDYPIYGLPGIALGQPQLRSMECLARRLLAVIRRVQPHGPYRLAGWSFGGVLAYEVAAQLLGMDETVAFLGLLDSYVPQQAGQGKAHWARADILEQQLLWYCRAHWQGQGAAGGTALAALGRLEAQAAPDSFAQLLEACRQLGLLSPSLAEASPQQVFDYLQREVAHGHAQAHYHLQPLGIPLHLFCAEVLPAGGARPSSRVGWQQVLAADALRCIDVPGSHQSLMQAPHVATLGQALGAALASAELPRAAPYQPLLTLQSGQPGHAPIFCIPGAGDSVTGFLGLTEALGPQWPIHGLQPRGVDGQGVPHSRVEAAAECYRQAVEQCCPHGPLHLIGHSFGGWVAYALAAALQARGRQVASLTLIDSEAPGGSLLGQGPTPGAALLRLIEALELSSGQTLGIDSQALVLADADSQLQQLHAGMVGAGLLSSRAAPQAMQGPLRTFSTALRTPYQPAQAYSGVVRLVLVEDPRLDRLGNQREHAAMLAGWRQQAPQLELWHGPGNHFSLLKTPQVASLAAWWLDGVAVLGTEVLR